MQINTFGENAITTFLSQFRAKTENGLMSN
jgi:hypothetical protein